MGQSAALYCRVSTADQTCARQERDLKTFAKKAGYKIVGVWKETGSGAKNDRAERKKILAFAAQTGLQFDLRSAQGKLIASLMAAEFERDLLRERVRSGIAAAKKRGRAA